MRVGIAAAFGHVRLLQPLARHGLFARVDHDLGMADREGVGSEASPFAAALDSQTVELMESSGPRGYDADMKAKGRKRQALADTGGRALVLDLQLADVYYPGGAVPMLRLSRRSFPFITKAFADTSYAGDKSARVSIIVIEIVRKSSDQAGFAVHPSRWVVERFFRCIIRNHRFLKDTEATLASARAFLYAAAVMILISASPDQPNFSDGLCGMPS